jgi:hypothetical protein
VDLLILVQAVLSGDLLSARQWVSDAERVHLEWPSVVQPLGLDEKAMALAAALVELLASRVGALPPAWAQDVGGLPEPFLVEPGISNFPRTLAWAMTHAPEPLRKRNLYASPDFLRVL